MSQLLDLGKQFLLLVPYSKQRELDDALTQRLLDLIEQADAAISAVQVGGISRPKGWRRWLAQLDGSRSLIVTPKTLGEPTVTVAWLPEAESGISRLVIGEFTTVRSTRDESTTDHE